MKRLLPLLLLALILTGCGEYSGPSEDVGWDELPQNQSEYGDLVPADPNYDGPVMDAYGEVYDDDEYEDRAAEEYNERPWFEKLADTSNCSCASNIYDCSDFDTDEDAMACMLRCYEQVGYDIHWLDGDDDGSACEWNP